jgi:hypothetical protein
VLIVSYLMAKSTPWEMQRSVQPVSKKYMGLPRDMQSTVMVQVWLYGPKMLFLLFSVS